MRQRKECSEGYVTETLPTSVQYVMQPVELRLAVIQENKTITACNIRRKHAKEINWKKKYTLAHYVTMCTNGNTCVEMGKGCMHFSDLQRTPGLIKKMERETSDAAK